LIIEKYGKVIKGLGGLYSIRVVGEDGITSYSCRAKGILHREDERLLIGDNVKIRIDDSTPDGIVISEIMQRKNALIRPPMANLDYLFIVFASKKPTPVLEVVDKLIAIAYHNNIHPVVVVTKNDLSENEGEKYGEIYKKAGIDTFVTSAEGKEGLSELLSYINSNVRDGATAAFAGASGVGKSTLMNALFPTLSLATSEISKKIERGRHTTRHVELFDISTDGTSGFLADTPGFSLVDFSRFDFFTIEDLPQTFPDLLPYARECTYSDCSHVGEGAADCAVARAAQEGLVSVSRLESYRAVYRILKNKTDY
jgi:ribosome biogenesis GTPase